MADTKREPIITPASAKKQRTRKWVHWAGKIDLTQKPKALCKPCWELRYCPYGALVEEFPLPHDRNDPEGCRIFGHECPVFHIAESFSETRELRRSSREIPQPVKIRVLFRDNRICAGCNKPIPVDQVHYDHIIPWTKGGPSAEHNVQLLCRKCNLSKGKDFEEDFLVKNFHDHLRKPVGTEFVRLLLAYFAVEFRQRQGRLPNAEQFAKAVGLKKTTDAERQMVEILMNLEEFFSDGPAKTLRKLCLTHSDVGGVGQTAMSIG